MLVIPVGTGEHQELRVISRLGDTQKFEEDVIERVRFVPLLGGTSR